MGCPEARGLGVAQELIAAIEAWAARLRASSLRLLVMSDNSAAIGLYRKTGFVFDGEGPRPFRLDAPRRTLMMTKAIAPAERD